MGRTPLYSRSPNRPQALGAAPAGVAAPRGTAADAGGELPADDAPPAPSGWRQQAAMLLARHERWAWACSALLLAAFVGWPAWTAKVQRPLTIEQIDSAMRDSIAKQPLASAAAAAYESIQVSVVRVVGEHAKPAGEPGDAKAGPGGKADKPPAGGAPSNIPGQPRQGAVAPRGASSPGSLPPGHPKPEEEGRSVGTGVVIVDKGLILTSLHVVAGASKLTVTFFDGTDSEAYVVNRDPANDLAVLQAKTIPDDLHAATLRSTAGLAPGDEVVAVGFPFGIGPSASAGIVSGLKREFRSPEGQATLTNLIQFDAAANPGNSGGPLITLDGHVVGIVTAIMNPTQARTFIGIGFAVPIENAAGAVGLHPF